MAMIHLRLAHDKEQDVTVHLQIASDLHIEFLRIRGPHPTRFNHTFGPVLVSRQRHWFGIYGILARFFTLSSRPLFAQILHGQCRANV